MFIGRRVWKCPRCGYVVEPDSTRLGERLGTAIGKYRGLVSGLMFGASTGNQIGQALDMYLIHVCKCPCC